ncbi:beta-ketoacyl-ACP synthase III [Aquisalimonas lutea]|uniref:beta-ketoacyl-ACP synthase III n=1 Tax=Aquisalimonas lutea TaxID=1327750 RepID=UPI0025B383D9|nr:beta-ketoacyl-ACP synthase III [Aquisalimonas lutea]MDN3517110.1 beta-ketoacyl-ACP synthase III [Aquisalimonas lutea]
MTAAAYITRLSGVLPNAPVDNERMEQVLGQVGERPSRARRIVLRNNGIRRRHYALCPETGMPTHNNAQLTAEAVRALAGDAFALETMDLLVCGTSTPDQLMPNHGVMVHGELGSPACEVTATAGICMAGVTALKYAFMSVRAGLARRAVTTGSELASTYLWSRHMRAEGPEDAEALERRPELAFDRDFLRWMLSDGAGALLVEGTPARRGLSLRIDWIECLSYAGELEPCMYAGAHKGADGRLTGWREYGSLQAAAADGAFSIKQDVKLLNEQIVRYTVGEGLSEVRRRRSLQPDEVDHFLPHYSSEYFRDRVAAELERIGFPIPAERWFTNLRERGNTGAASIYLMLEELFHGGTLQPGQRILCFVPESGRFSTAYMLLTVVAPDEA